MSFSIHTINIPFERFNCLKLKREAERNLSESRENVIRYQCGQVEAELVPDSEGKMKILRIIKHKYEH